MKKDQIIGMLLIGVILIAYTYYTKPTKEEIETARIQRDSIEQVQQQLAQTRMIEQEQRKIESDYNNDNIIDSKVAEIKKDSILNGRYGPFSGAASGNNDFVYIENDLVKLKIATKGGRVYSAELKEYQTHDSLPLVLFDGDSTIFGFDFFTLDNLPISTNNLFRL